MFWKGAKEKLLPSFTGPRSSQSVSSRSNARYIVMYDVNIERRHKLQDFDFSLVTLLSRIYGHPTPSMDKDREKY